MTLSFNFTPPCSPFLLPAEHEKENLFFANPVKY